MLYDAYEKRILKISNVLRFIRKHALIILLATVLFLTATVTFLVTKGMTGKTNCPPQITYGESLPCEANAFLSRVRFEYRSGSGPWSETPPHTPGTYSVRAVGNSVTGKPRYGEESTFVEVWKGMQEGKKVCGVNLCLNINDSPYSARVAYPDLILRSAKLPKIKRDKEDDDPDGLFLERMYFFETLYAAFDGIFDTFVHLRVSDAWQTEAQAIKDWVLDH